MYKVIFFLTVVLLFTSCKAKYEALLIKYNNTQDKKRTAIKDTKVCEKKTTTDKEKIKQLKPELDFWKRYATESTQIVNYKKRFIVNGYKAN
jgi:hypothetical protein